MRIATREQMLEIEELAMRGGLSVGRLMENAGSAAANAIRAIAGTPTQTVILCGNGNNGGDGFVIARKLAENGYSVTVILLNGSPRTDAAADAFSKMRDIPVIVAEAEPYRAAAVITDACVVVDAVYGIGFHGALPDAVAHLFSLVKPSQLRFDVDIPSGVVCDSGAADPAAFSATHTLTFTAMKPALTVAENADIYGQVQVLSIGISDADIAAVIQDNTLQDADIAACFPKRLPDTHKGSYGHLLAVCGSYGMAGAAILSARAALRSGVGLLTVALPRSIYPIVSAAVPEAVFLPLPESENGTISMKALSALLAALDGKDALLIGCGLGQSSELKLLVRELLIHAACPIVLDADGLNAIATHIDVLKTGKAPRILTPHPGEMARLLSKSVAQVQENRTGISSDFARRFGVTLVLKGYHTLVTTETEQVVNPTGNPGMATGGSGDVLAGMIASFAAQGMSPPDAAKCGVYLHGKAGDAAAKKYSQHAMLPSDMLSELGTLFLKFEE